MNEPNDDAIEALLRQQFQGHVPDEGFSERVMRQLPPRRRRAAWPRWVGVLTGMAMCWPILGDMPVLRTGWADWLAGVPSSTAIGMWVAITALSLLALGWGLAESGRR